MLKTMMQYGFLSNTDCRAAPVHGVMQQVDADSRIFYSYMDGSIHYSFKEDSEVLLFDALGRVVFKKQITGGQGRLRLPTTLSGIYFLKVGRSATVTIVL